MSVILHFEESFRDIFFRIFLSLFVFFFFFFFLIFHLSHFLTFCKEHIDIKVLLIASFLYLHIFMAVIIDAADMLVTSRRKS